MDTDTRIGGYARVFPDTRGSLIADMRSPDADRRARAGETIVAAYWKPVYKYIRRKWNRDNEDAKDLTQSFFARALEKELIEAFDPEKASFRTYLRMCLDAFVSNERKAGARLKRGGGLTFVALEFDSAESELRREPAAAAESIDDYFQKESVRSLFELAVERLRRECVERGREAAFGVFERYDLDTHDGSLTYASLGAELGLSSATVTNYLASTRRRFRETLLGALRELTGSEREFRAEARALLGIEI